MHRLRQFVRWLSNGYNISIISTFTSNAIPLVDSDNDCLCPVSSSPSLFPCNLHILSIHSIIVSPPYFNISTVIPSTTVAFTFFKYPVACITSSLLIFFYSCTLPPPSIIPMHVAIVSSLFTFIKSTEYSIILPFIASFSINFFTYTLFYPLLSAHL